MMNFEEFGLTESTFYACSHLAAGLCMGLGAVGPGVGEGFAGHSAVGAISRQPKAALTITRVMLIGQAIAETSGIFALLMGILLLFAQAPVEPAWSTFAAMIGSGICMGLGAVGVGLGIGITAGRACDSVARQPAHSATSLREMLIGQAITETPAIFALVVAMLLFFGAPLSTTEDLYGSLHIAVAMIAAGLCMGVGAIGSGAGAGLVSADAVDGIGRFRGSSGPVFRMMIIGQGISQSPSVYALVVALILIFGSGVAASPLLVAAGLLGAACAAGFAAVGPGMGIGFAGGRACAGVARNVASYGPTFRGMLIGMAVTESTAIYGLVIAFLLLFQ